MASFPILLGVFHALFLSSIENLVVVGDDSRCSSSPPVDSPCPSAAAPPPPPPYKHDCVFNEYPPSPSDAPSVQSFVVDLDTPPEKRWNHVIKQFVKPLKRLTDYMDPIFAGFIRSHLGSYFPVDFLYWLVGRALPDPVYAELIGVAEAFAAEGIRFNSLVCLNVFYEMFTACTSVVARNPVDGRVIVGRNLDWGGAFGTDPVTKEFVVTEILRDMTVNVDFRRRGETLYSGTTYVGILSALNGVKKGKFSASLNQRATEDSGDAVWNIFTWALGLSAGSPITVVARRLFEEEADSYEEARNYLESVPLVSPAYYVLGGVSGDEGCLVTRSKDQSLSPVSLATAADSWILQTNYDHWKAPPTWDDRRTPGKYCMRQMENSTSFASLFNVFSTKPTLLMETTYTSLMDATSGRLETYVRTCSPPSRCGWVGGSQEDYETGPIGQ